MQIQHGAKRGYLEDNELEKTRQPVKVRKRLTRTKGHGLKPNRKTLDLNNPHTQEGPFVDMKLPSFWTNGLSQQNVILEALQAKFETPAAPFCNCQDARPALVENTEALDL